MRDYGKIFSKIWESDDFRALSEDGRTLALYLLSCKHGTIAGVFRLPDGYACEDLQWSPERVSKGFADLFAKGFATRCNGTKWVWVVKFLEWNEPENPNQKKAAAKVAAQVPAECTWRALFLSMAAPILGPSIQAEDAAAGAKQKNPLGTLEEPLANQKQKQKQEQEYSEANASGADAPVQADLIAPQDPEPPKGPEPVKAVDVIFGLGLPLLVKAGVPESNARSFLGLQRKGGDDRLAGVIRSAIETQALQPLEFIAGCMNVKPTRASKHAGFEAKDYHAGANADGSF